jgi:two-component system, OmpR family, sensor histidine kinase MprB
VRVQLMDTLDDALLGRAQAAASSSQLGDPARLVQLPAAAFLAADVRIALVRADGVAISAEGAASAPPLGAP